MFYVGKCLKVPSSSRSGSELAAARTTETTTTQTTSTETTATTTISID